MYRAKLVITLFLAVLAAGARAQTPSAPRGFFEIRVLPETARPGDLVTLLFTAHNSGDSPIADTSIASAVPANFQPAPGSATGATCFSAMFCSPGSRIVWNTGTIPPNGTRTVFLAGHVLGGRDSRIRVEGSFRSGREVQATASAPIHVDAASDLKLAVTADHATVQPGGLLDYTVLLVNTSSEPMISTAVNAVPSPGVRIVDATEPVWSVDRIEPGASAFLRFRVQAGDSMEGTAMSVAVTAQGQTGTALQSATAGTSTLVKRDPPLELTINGSPGTIVPGELSTLAVTVARARSAEPGLVTLAGVVPNNTGAFPATAVDATCPGRRESCTPGATLTWSFFLNGGESRTVLIPARVLARRALAMKRQPDAGLVAFTVVASSDGDSVAQTGYVAVESTPAWSLGLEPERFAASDGELMRFRAVLVHRKAVTSPDVRLSAPIPVGTTFASATHGGVLDGSQVVWDLGAMRPGDVVIRDFAVVPGSADSRPVVATASAGPLGKTFGEVQASAAAVQGTPLVQLMATAVPLLTAGGSIGYDLELFTTGSAPAHAVIVRAILPDFIEPFAGTDGAQCGGAGNICRPGSTIVWPLGTLENRNPVLIRLRIKSGSSSFAGPPASLLHLEATVTSSGGSGDHAAADAALLGGV